MLGRKCIVYGHDLGRRAGSTAPQSNKQADLQLASGCLVCRQLTQEGKGNKEAKKKSKEPKKIKEAALDALS